MRGVVLQEERHGSSQEAQHALLDQTGVQARAGGHGVRATVEEHMGAGGGQSEVALDLVRRGQELQQRLQQAVRRQAVLAQHAVEVQQEGHHGALVAQQQLQQQQRTLLGGGLGARGQQRALQDLGAARAKDRQLRGTGGEEGREGGGRVLQRQLVQHLQRRLLQRGRRVGDVQQHGQRGLRPRQQLLRQRGDEALAARERALDVQRGDGGRGELQQRLHQQQRLLHRRAGPGGPGGPGTGSGAERALGAGRVLRAGGQWRGLDGKHALGERRSGEQLRDEGEHAGGAQTVGGERGDAVSERLHAAREDGQRAAEQAGGLLGVVGGERRALEQNVVHGEGEEGVQGVAAQQQLRRQSGHERVQQPQERHRQRVVARRRLLHVQCPLQPAVHVQ